MPGTAPNARICTASPAVSTDPLTVPNGGYARAGADRALVTECHPGLGPISRGLPIGFQPEAERVPGLAPGDRPVGHCLILVGDNVAGQTGPAVKVIAGTLADATLG